jgi:hypothetical protein
MKKLAAVVVLGVALSGCSHMYGTPHDRVVHGALIGAGVGGVVGGVATGNIGGVAVGAGIGALAGAAIATATGP